MKKVSLAIAVTAAVAALSLAGCTSSATSGSGSDGGDVTITFAHWGDNEENATLKSMVALFEKANPDVQVQSNWIQGNYTQQLQVSIAGGQAPTVAQISNTDLPSFAGAFSSVNLDPSDYYASNIPDSMEINGKAYAVPFTVKPKVMAINKTLFQKAGIPLPSSSTPMTPQEFATTAAKLTSGSGKSEVFGSAPLWFEGWLSAEGGSLFNADATQCTSGSATAITTTDFIVDAQSSHGFTPSYLAQQGQDMFDWLSIGRIAMQPDFGPWNVSQLLALPNVSDYALVPVPGEGEPMEIDGLAVSNKATSAQAVAAQKFVQFMATDLSAQQLLTTKQSSLGAPVVQGAISEFKSAAPSLAMSTFINAVSQSRVTQAPKQYAQLDSTFDSSLFSGTAIGTGHGNPATVLPQLQAACQQTLESGGSGQ
jgi:multiple sugar transport system substrate-binding protein